MIEYIEAAYWSELEKIAAAISPGGMPAETSGEMVANEESPAHGVVASRVRQLDPKRALGIPVMQPPPGFVYRPDLTAFVPDEQDPGWMPEQVVPQAENNQAYYAQGQQDQQVQQAQQQIDDYAAQDVAEAQQQQAQQQEMGQIQQVESAKAHQQALREAAKAGFSDQRPQTSRPRGTKKTKKPAAGAGKGKGVTIRIGS